MTSMTRRAQLIAAKITNMLKNSDDKWVQLNMKNGSTLYVVYKGKDRYGVEQYDLYKTSMNHPRYRILKNIELASIANDIDEMY